MRSTTNETTGTNQSTTPQQSAVMLPTVSVNGKEIVMTYADGRWWIAVKPICEVLNVHYKAQHRAILEDKILSQLSSIQRTVGADGKQREMLCISERFIYGWLFGINSESEELLLYKMECYNALYNHFHSSQSRRNVVLKETTLIDQQIEDAKKELAESPVVQKLNKLLEQKKLGTKTLKLLDREIVGRQLPLWNEETKIDNAQTPANDATE